MCFSSLDIYSFITSLHPLINSSILYLLFTGIIAILFSLLVACSDIESVQGIFSFARSYIFGTNPLVEILICLAPIFNPFGYYYYYPGGNSHYSSPYQSETKPS